MPGGGWDDESNLHVGVTAGWLEIIFLLLNPEDARSILYMLFLTELK